MQNCIVPVVKSTQSIVCAIDRLLKSFLLGVLRVVYCGAIAQIICVIIGGMKLCGLHKNYHQMRVSFNRCHFMQHRRTFNWSQQSKKVWHRGQSYCGNVTNYMTGNMTTTMAVVMSGTYSIQHTFKLLFFLGERTRTKSRQTKTRLMDAFAESLCVAKISAKPMAKIFPLLSLFFMPRNRLEVVEGHSAI